MLEEYNVVFEPKKKIELACPILNTRVIKKHGEYTNDERITKIGNDITIYPSKYFDPISPNSTKNLVCNDTFSIHRYSATWTSSKKRFKRKIANIIGQDRINRIKTILKK